jgi:hypothetical protein
MTAEKSQALQQVQQQQSYLVQAQALQAQTQQQLATAQAQIDEQKAQIAAISGKSSFSPVLITMAIAAVAVGVVVLQK